MLPGRDIVYSGRDIVYTLESSIGSSAPNQDVSSDEATRSEEVPLHQIDQLDPVAINLINGVQKGNGKSIQIPEWKMLRKKIARTITK